MSQLRILIVKTGSTVASILERRGDFEAWIAEGLDIALGDLEIANVSEGCDLPGPGAVDAVVITGSPAFVSERAPWSVRTEEWIARVVRSDTPVLGICYGHQLIAQALGGEVGRNPNGRQIGTVRVDLSAAAREGDALLGKLPATSPLHATHLESVLRLPDGAVLLGTTEADPHHAFRLGARVWGVQFHPEFDADVMRSYVHVRADELRAEGIDPVSVEAGIQETPYGDAVLRGFVDIVRQGVTQGR